MPHTVPTAVIVQGIFEKHLCDVKSYQLPAKAKAHPPRVVPVGMWELRIEKG